DRQAWIQHACSPRAADPSLGLRPPSPRSAGRGGKKETSRPTPPPRPPHPSPLPGGEREKGESPAVLGFPSPPRGEGRRRPGEGASRRAIASISHRERGGVEREVSKNPASPNATPGGHRLSRA